MAETLQFSQLYAEDFDLGPGLREVRLQNGFLASLHRVHLGTLVPFSRVVLPTSNGAAVLTATGALQVGMRVMGITVEVLDTFGNTNGLTGLQIGDTAVPGRWGTGIGRVAGTQTGFVDFADDTMPIYRTASDVIVEAIGGTFDTTGRIECKIWYWVLTHH